MTISVLFITVVCILFFLLFIAMFVKKAYKKVPQGQAIIRSGFGGVKVSFNGMTVLPVLHQMEKVDISIKRMPVNFSGEKGLLFKDGILADMEGVFFVRVYPSREGVLMVAQSVGAKNTFDEKNIYNLFELKVKQVIRTVAKENSFGELYNNTEKFLVLVLESIGTDLNGYSADDFNISYLQKTAEGHPS